VRVLSRLFRRLFLAHLEEPFEAGKLRFISSLEALRDPQAFQRHLDSVRGVEWVVYAKPPFSGPQQVVDYVIPRSETPGSAEAEMRTMSE
jgi:hypothetical protein